MMIDVTSDSGRCGAPGVVSTVNIVVSTLMERSIKETCLLFVCGPEEKASKYVDLLVVWFAGGWWDVLGVCDCKLRYRT